MTQLLKRKKGEKQVVTFFRLLPPGNGTFLSKFNKQDVSVNILSTDTGKLCGPGEYSKETKKLELKGKSENVPSAIDL